MNWSDVACAIDNIPGYLSYGQDGALYSLAEKTPSNGVIIEIGSFKGKSTACLAAACVNTDRIVYAIDPFESQPSEEYSEDIWTYSIDDISNNLKKLGLLDYVRLTKGYSQDIGENWSIECDMLFIDGAHTYEGCLSDFNLFFKWLKPDGILALHDVAEGSPWDGVLRVWREEAIPRLYNIGKVDSLAFGNKLK